jgi:hypothetical protein
MTLFTNTHFLKHHQMNNLFSADALSVSMANIATSAILLQTYSQTIAAQPVVSLDEVPGFSLDQKSVQRTALNCLTDITPDLVALSAEDIGFANQFNEMYIQLLKDAQLIDDATADANARQTATTDFCNGLKTLLSTISNGQIVRNNMMNTLTQFDDLVASNQVSLDADLIVAQKQLLDGDIAKLQAQLSTIQNQIDADNQIVASGGVYGVVAGIKIGVAVIVGWYKDPAKGINMAIGEIEGIVKESDKHSAALADLQTQDAAYKSTITQLLYDESVYAVVQNVTFTTDLLAAHVKGSSLAVKSFSDAWNTLSENFTDIISTLANGPKATLQLTSSLQAARSGWVSLLQQAKYLQSMGTLPVSVSN